jgi:tetratricopeptide (TPR) repeat protein
MTTFLTVNVLLGSLVAGPLVPTGSSAAIAADTAPNQNLLDLMAEGKTETDLGHYDVAIRALTAIVEAGQATPALRTEALVRLGVARRATGDFERALESFQRAAKSPSLDAETKALLVQALGGPLPGPGRWAQIWPRVSFTVDRSVPKQPTLAVIWPDVAAVKAYRGQPITLDLKNGELQDLFRLIADVSGLNVVVNPGVRGQFSAHMQNQPWDLVLDRILSANGLAYRWEDNVLRIAAPEQLFPPQHFSGQRIDVDFRNTDLRKALAEIAAQGDAHIDIDPVVQGDLTIKLNQVRWDQALDIVVRVNGLDWAREGKTLKVFPAGKSRR